MAMTTTEKVIAKHAGRDRVEPGDLVVVDIDRACADDVQFFIFEARLRELGGEIRRPERTALMADHYLPPAGVDEAGIVQSLAKFGRERSLPTFLREGIKHPVFVEERLVGPGQILVATDSHTNTAGAVGALALSLGPTDVAAVFATGKTWLRVPETILFEIDGPLPPGVLPMDLGLDLLGRHGRAYATYKAIEWAGSTIADLPLPGRMTLCNLTTEFGAKNGIVAPDGVTAAWLGDAVSTHDFLVSDADARFSAVHRYRSEEFAPVVAVPPSPANVHPVADLRGTRVDQAYLGTCTHSTLEDLHLAAQVLDRRRVHPSVRLIVTPATQRVYDAALADGTFRILSAAGGTITSPGCGSCPGMHEGTLAENEVRISTQNRNFVGRSGHPTSQIYLASPVTVAASAVAGEIVEAAEVTA